MSAQNNIRVLNNRTLVDFGKKIITTESGIFIDYTDERPEYQPKRAIVVKSSDKDLKEGDELFISYLGLLNAEDYGMLIVDNPTTNEKRGFIENNHIHGIYREDKIHAYKNKVITKPIIETATHSILEIPNADKESEFKSVVFGKNDFYPEGEIIHVLQYGLVPMEYEMTKTVEKLFCIDISMIWGYGETPTMREDFVMIKYVMEKNESPIIYEGKKNLVRAKILKSGNDEFYEGQVIYTPASTITGTFGDNKIIHKDDIILI